MSIERDWITKAGLRAVVMVHPSMGHRCGYVAVPTEHPAFGAHYDADLLSGIDVHGGLTFASDGGHYPVEAPDLWWLGYDCAHLGDFVPGLNHGCAGDVLRDLPYCEHECESLAQQLADLSKPSAREAQP